MQRAWQDPGKCLALAGSHFNKIPSCQQNARIKLHIMIAKTKRAVERMIYQRESLGQQRS